MMYYVGMMSGTSLDGIDAVLAAYTPDADGSPWKVVHHVEIAIPHALKEALYQLNFPDVRTTVGYQGELHAAKTAEQQLTQCYAQAYQQLMNMSEVNARDIIAIGAHGQTIRHEPNAKWPYTVQLLNGALLSHLTQQTVICDFRSKDIAAGGQGAPLAPLFHQQLFAIDHSFAVVNIGGIANVSLIDNTATPTLLSGFDCGPGNCLMDEWIMQHRNKPYDHDGAWARDGRVLPDLLSRFLSDAYFAKPVPKSTGRDYFNPTWVQRYVSGDESPADVMRTLLCLSAQAIVDILPATLHKLIVVGGGAKNTLLCQTIAEQLHQRGDSPHVDVEQGNTVGIDVQQVEALGFALLAKACLDRQRLSTMAITGSQAPVVCGAIYQN